MPKTINFQGNACKNSVIKKFPPQHIVNYDVSSGR
jgi:hypothetical protein